MKNRLLLISVILCLSILLSYSANNSNKPFSGLKSESIERVELQMLPPNSQVTITDREEIAELVKILNTVIIHEEDDSYNEYCGQLVQFTLTMKDGRTTIIAAYNPFLIIDGIGYQTEYEPCEKLNAFGNNIAQ